MSETEATVEKTEEVAKETAVATKPEGSSEIVTLDKGNLAEIVNFTKEMGLDPQEQINKQNSSMAAQPFLKVEHDDKEGKHGFYIQLPTGIFDDTGIHRLGTREKPVDKLDLQIVLFEDTRSIFEKGEKMPKCASADGRVLGFIKESLNNGKRTCEGCPFNAFGTDCKPRIRSLVGFKYSFEGQPEAIYPFIFQLPPGSLSNWNKFTKRLTASKAPLQSFVLTLTLEDHNDVYRYAKINFDVSRVIGPEEQTFAKEVVSTLKKQFEQASVAEFVETTTSGNQSNNDEDVAF